MSSNRLIVLAIGGILVSAICFGVAVGVGGRSVMNHLGDLDNFDFAWDGPRCGVTLANASGTRSLDWHGGDRVTIEVPANIHYKRGEGTQVVVSGDSALLPLVEIDDNRIRFNCHMRRIGQRLDITLPGRDFERYIINGSADMTLEDISQSRLHIRMAGSGSVTASGRTDDLEYSVAGSGDGHFENLDAGRVSVNVAGSGDADVSPRQRLEVNIAGSGKVTLHSEPQQLETHIAGSGRIVHTDGSVTRKNGLSSSSDNHRDQDREKDWDAPPAPPAPPKPPKGI